MARRRPAKAGYAYHGMGLICVGIAFLIVAAMMYLGYGWIEIFAVIGILAILKGIWKMKK